MRKIKETSNVEISGMFENASFGIVESEHTYELLTGKQYTNPWTATIRALLENALDAQTEAKVDRLIDVNFQDTRLVITDYGNGISPEVMEQYYTKYFASNRTSSDEFYGGFGVGSKAIFSVVKYITLQTKHEGTLYEWRLSKEHNAKPTAELRHTQPTSEKGTTIHIELQESIQTKISTHDLKRELIGFLLAFDRTAPNTIKIGNLNEFVRQNSVHEHIRKYNIPGPVLRIGLMPYPLPPADILKLPEHMYQHTNLVIKSLDRKKFGLKDADIRSATSEYLNLDVGIGDVEPHYSKERVAYTVLTSLSKSIQP